MGLMEREVLQPCRYDQGSAGPQRNMSECPTLGQMAETLYSPLSVFAYRLSQAGCKLHQASLHS